MKKIMGTLGALALLLLLCFGWFQARGSGATITKVTDVGSTALQPLAEAAIPGFLKNHQNINVTVQGGGSGTGLSQVQARAVDIGSSDVFAAQQAGIDANKLTDHIIVVTGIVPIVNPKLGVDNLSMDQLRGIFAGKITNWKEVGGPDKKITVINRASGSGTRLAFEQVVMGRQETVKAQEQDSNGTVKQIVSNVPGAISYVSSAYLNDQVKALMIDHVEATSKNVSNNRWKLWSYEHMYTTKHAKKATLAYIRYLQSADVQSHLVKEAHYISIHDMKVKRDADGVVTKIGEKK